MSRNTTKLLIIGLSVCAATFVATGQMNKSDGPPPDTLPAKFVHPVGNATAGQEVFRFETFNNQGFWTDAAQLPQGIAEARVTPIQALQLGLNVNIDAVNDQTKQAVAQALMQVQGGTPPAQTALGPVTPARSTSRAATRWASVAPSATPSPTTASCRRRPCSAFAARLAVSRMAARRTGWTWARSSPSPGARWLTFRSCKSATTC